MNQRAMRRICAALVRSLDLRHPVEPDELITTLCRYVGQKTGRDVRHMVVAFPPHTVSGLWIATETTDYILCEQHTSSWHRLLITSHETWHLLKGHYYGLDQPGVLAGIELTSLDPSALGRIMAGRGPYDAKAEREADLFASMLLTKLTRGRHPPLSLEPTDDVTIHRVARTLRGDGGEHRQ